MSIDLVAEFRAQQKWCAALGSPFTAALLGCAAQAMEAGDEPAGLFANREWRRADAAALRFAGAVHGLALSGRDRTLAHEYPAARADWDIERVWRAAQMAMRREPEWFADFIRHAPQTNETRRAFALMPAFHKAAEIGPLHLWEVGASAGLNLHWDKFAYDAGAWSWGQGPLKMDTEWRGAAPALRETLVVASRAGCDVNPLDIRNAEHLLRLRSYIWADQDDRLARFDNAVAIALADYTPIAAMDAGEWLEAQVDAGLREGVTILFHSIAWQYFPPETVARAEAAIARAAAMADERHRFAWARFEITDMPDGRHDVDLVVWPGGERHVLAKASPHVGWVEWF
jgi:hypothetical protein